MAQQKQIILASSSVYRRQQLTQLGLSFECESPHIDETPQPGEEAQQLALRLAAAKAAAVLRLHPDAVIIGSDQVADLNRCILGKPMTFPNAVQQLSACANNQVNFYTGVCVASTKQSFTSVVLTQVKFLPLSQATIYEYIRKESPLDCAGSFKCEGLGIALFESISSDDPTALIGLPLISVNLMLAKHGVNVLDP